MNKKYFDDPITERWIPKEVVRWLENIVGNSLNEAKNESAKQKVEHKARHTLGVTKWGNKLVEKVIEVAGNKKQAVIICFLHDVGRFPQVQQNDNYSDIATGIDHAGLGATMISKWNFNWEKVGCNKAEIIEAIMWHNKKEYKGSNPYAKFIRGADKLRIFQEWEEIKKDAREQGQTGTKIKEAVWKTLEEKQPIGDKVVESWAEKILNLSSWLWNIDYQSIRKEAIKMGVDKVLLEELKSNGNSVKEIKRLKMNLEEFRKSA